MRERGIDAIVCARPTSVLLLSGYWPVVGNTLAIATIECTVLLTPTDELPLARSSPADAVYGYEFGSLKKISTLVEDIEPPLRDLLRKLKLDNARIGFEAGPWVQPSPYAALSSFGEMLSGMLHSCVVHAHLVPIDDMLAQLRMVKTDHEIAKIRSSCEISARGFHQARTVIRRDATEIRIAGEMRAALMESDDPTARCDGFAFCMSGPNAAEAYKFFQHTRRRALCDGDMALVHCNSHVNGYWTDVTRTFHLNEPASRARGMYRAVLAAREAALAMIRPGVRCCDVDRTARSIMEDRGFAEQFKHSLGHGVGFSAIDHNAKPRLHPLSPDVLREGMVFNIEPAIYVAGQCGIRHCDMVTCGKNGPELLTTFQDQMDQLVVS